MRLGPRDHMMTFIFNEFYIDKILTAEYYFTIDNQLNAELHKSLVKFMCTSF